MWFPAADGIQIEISSTQAVTPQVTKLTSPARVLVELPETVVATAQNKIPVGSGRSEGRAHRNGRQDSSDDQRRGRSGEALGV